MVHYALGVVLGMISFGLWCVWSSMMRLNMTINAATRQDLYDKMYSAKYAKSLEDLQKTMFFYSWSLIGGTIAAVVLMVCWVLVGTNIVGFGEWLVPVYLFCSAMMVRVWQHKEVPNWVKEFGKMITIKRGRLNVEIYQSRLNEVEVQIAVIKQRADDNAMTTDDAGRLIRLAYEKTQLLQTLEVTRERLQQMSR